MTRAAKYRMRILGELKSLRKSQAWLAGRLGISEQTMSIKFGGAAFTEEQMREIQKIFGWRTLEGEE